MELPLPLLNSCGFLFDNTDDIFATMDKACQKKEKTEINRLFSLGLPPITSLQCLSAMTGLNSGFLWALNNKPEKYYRFFHIPKGTRKRKIEAPKVGLKIIQKWLSVHFEQKWSPCDVVHGFVKGRSHITSAYQHLGAKWVISLDIENFFPTTSKKMIRESLIDLGYKQKDSLDIIESLCRFGKGLPQGAPTSPVLSNISFHAIDEKIIKISENMGITYTRYADDLVFSGKGEIKKEIINEVRLILENTTWKISERKKYSAELPYRLKVHGLLVDGEKLRLTKGYRNKIRTFKYQMEKRKLANKDPVRRISGHINYANYVENFGN